MPAPSYYSDIFSKALQQVKDERRYRVFTEISYSSHSLPKAFHPKLNREITVWCSNDYLGMSQHPDVVAAMVQAAQEFGVGAGGTRNISGTNTAIVALERELADLHKKQKALVFTSGYVANQAAISTIAKIIPDCIMFSDAANHASMIQGIRDGKAEKIIFEHNNLEDLEAKLKSVPYNRSKLILFEAVYSMLGDIAPVKEICELARRYNALTYLDEVHSVGLYGKEGAGIAELQGVMNEVDIIQGTLSKAFGVIGGYIAGNHDIIDAIRSCASGFIFTTALPPAVSAAALASIRHLRYTDNEREAHQNVVKLLKEELKSAAIRFHRNDTHIIAIEIGDPLLCEEISLELLSQHGIYVQHINYPTVPKGTERLRITPTPFHTAQMVHELVNSLSYVLNRYSLPLAA